MNAYSFLIMFLSVVLSPLTSFCSGKGFAPVRIEGDSYEAQGELIDGKPVTGQGVKVSVKRSKQGRGDTIHRYTVRIQPGDSWEHGTASGRTVWIEGHGTSQIMVSLPADTAEITNTRVLIIGKTREQTMKELQAIVTGAFKGYAEEQIKQAADKAKDIVFGIPTSYIELEEPFEISPRDGLIVLKCDFEGADDSKRFDKIEEVIVSFDLTYKKPGKHYVVITPDIRATGNLVDPSLPLRGSIGGYYLIEYRQELILTSQVVSGGYSSDRRLLHEADNEEINFDYRLKSTLKGHKVWQDVSSVTYSSDGEYIASGSNDSTIKLWDATTGRCLRTLKAHRHGVNSVAFSPDGKVIVSGGDDHMVKLWDTATGQCLQTLKGHSSAVYSVVFSPDGRRIASLDGEHLVPLWNVREGRAYSGLNPSTRCFAFCSDGQRIAAVNLVGDLVFCDPTTGRRIREFEIHLDTATCVAFSPDGHQLVLGSEEGIVRVWNEATGKYQKLERSDSFDVPGWTHEDFVLPINSVTFCPDGQLIVSGRGAASGWLSPKIEVWDTVTGRRIQALAYDHHPVWSVAFSPDGKRIVSGAGGGMLEIWEAAQVIRRADINRVRCEKTIACLKVLHTAVLQFKMDTARYPTEEEGLMALIEQPSDAEGWQAGGYLETKKIPRDSWGNNFIYEKYPESGKQFVIISYGADGEEGGEGDAADLLSTDKN